MIHDLEGRSMLVRSLAVAATAIAAACVASAAYGDVVSASPNLTQVTCSDIAAQSEEERAAALIFFYGYMAGLSGALSIDESRVAGQLIAVRDYCNSHPDATVIAAFVAALQPAG